MTVTIARSRAAAIPRPCAIARPSRVAPMVAAMRSWMWVTPTRSSFGVASTRRTWATRLPNAHEKRVAIEVYMDNAYLEVISYVERLHRQFLEVAKLELEGLIGSSIRLAHSCREQYGCALTKKPAAI